MFLSQILIWSYAYVIECKQSLGLYVYSSFLGPRLLQPNGKYLIFIKKETIIIVCDKLCRIKTM